MNAFYRTVHEVYSSHRGGLRCLRLCLWRLVVSIYGICLRWLTSSVTMHDYSSVAVPWDILGGMLQEPWLTELRLRLEYLQEIAVLSFLNVGLI